MRCPYCGRNSEKANYCTSCGRDLTKPMPGQPAARQQPPYQQPPPYQQAPPYQQPPPYEHPSTYQQPPQAYPASAPRQAPPTQGRPVPPTVPQQQQPPPRARQQPAPVAPPAPDAPAPFPPHTMEQLQALETGALAFNVLDTIGGDRRKKIVRITYPKCVAWQQVATLLKAFKEQKETQFETIIIQGYLPQDPGGFNFTNGQLSYDQNVRLGSQTMNRYQIETGNGFEIDSVRIVLSE